MRLSYDAADHKFASNNAVSKDDIFNSAVIDVAEKTLIIAGSVDSYAADGMAVSIKDASERSGADVISDGSIVALVLAETFIAVCDVVTQLEVFVVEVVGLTIRFITSAKSLSRQASALSGKMSMP